MREEWEIDASGREGKAEGEREGRMGESALNGTSWSNKTSTNATSSVAYLLLVGATWG